MRSLLNIITVGCGVLALAFMTGLLRPGLTPATLMSHAQRSVEGCMQTAGFSPDSQPSGSSPTSARNHALKRCWSDAARDPRYERLALDDPIAVDARLRDEGFKTWRCAERAGYVRTTTIPLNEPGGYPLMLAAGNFRVGSGERALERFYRAAAKCSGDSLEMYRWSNGRFSPDPSDGTHCIRHRDRGGELHSHGCYGTDTYPNDPGTQP
jgi:hypothetical protein